MRHQEQSNSPLLQLPITLEKCKQMIVEMGGRVSNGGSWEDEDHIYASSIETWGPSTYGHPKYEVQFQKSSGWLSRSGLKPIRLEGEKA